jgi:mannose-6-phosphate isomerase
VLGADGADARVHLGFTRDVEPAELDGWIAAQEVSTIIDSLHAVEVKAGDAVLIPAGLPHAIGAGVFCVELQEPTDFSVMLELAGFGDLDPDQARLGLDADLARECVRSKALGPRQLEHLRTADRSGAALGGSSRTRRIHSSERSASRSRQAQWCSTAGLASSSCSKAKVSS